MEEASVLFENAAKFAAGKGIARFTRFIDPAQAAAAQRIARAHDCAFTMFGGYDRAERVIGCFHAYDEIIPLESFPLICLQAKIPVKFCQISHRDLLGAFMALGLTRDCIGDIIIVDGYVYLFTTEQTSAFIASSLTSAGRAALHFIEMSQLPTIPPPAGTTFSAVVSSLRLDAVLAAAYKLSRNEAAERIRAGLVKVDHIEQQRIDYPLKPDSLLSVRGKGRVRFVSVDGTTRKERIGITLFRYE